MSSLQRTMRAPIVDNASMPSPTDWHPVIPAHRLGLADRLVATRLLGHDLVAWRSPDGVARVWHDRCPHRGVRLSLGRILGGRLSCAYHGWEFAADSGRCEVIPALADMARVPGQTHARVCTTAEARAMVWVRLATDTPASPGLAPCMVPTGPAPGSYLRSLAIDAGVGAVHLRLRALGLQSDGPAAWVGTLAQQTVRLFLQQAQADLVVVHAWACAPPVEAARAALFSALGRLRSDAESAGG